MSAEPDSGWPSDFATGTRNRDALLVLSGLRGLTPRKLLELAEREGTAEACARAVAAGRGGSEADHRHAREADAGEMRSALQRCGARMVAAGDDGYPPSLLNIPDPPAALFIRGEPLAVHDLHVAVVGARNGSPLGREVARDLARGVAALGGVVVSGAARGIDAAAHAGALSGSGRTVAVLGSGIDVDYPRSNAKLLEAIARSGSVISEYPPGVPAEPFRFPARNRIIAGMSAAAVIVEGDVGSGSLITAEHALEFGREVYAIPGAVNNPLARAPLSMIREGAAMIRGVEDLVADLGLGDATGDHPLLGLSLPEQAVLERIAGPTLPDAIARGLGCPVASVMPALLQLEMKGFVRNLGGRVDRTNRAGAS